MQSQQQAGYLYGAKNTDEAPGVCSPQLCSSSNPLPQLSLSDIYFMPPWEVSGLGKQTGFEEDDEFFIYILHYFCTVVSWGWIHAPFALKKRKGTWRRANWRASVKQCGWSAKGTGWKAMLGAPASPGSAWTSAEQKFSSVSCTLYSSVHGALSTCSCLV